MPDQGTDHHLGGVLREHRETLGMSVRALAHLAEFSPSFISQVENGLASPSIGSLEKIASCLGVSLAELFQRKQNFSTNVVRSRERSRIESEWSKAEIESLQHSAASRLHPLLIRLQPGGASGKKTHAVSREQFVFVVSGRVELQLDGAHHRLGKGDAIMIRAHAQTLWKNDSQRPVALLVVSSGSQ